MSRRDVLFPELPVLMKRVTITWYIAVYTSPPDTHPEVLSISEVAADWCKLMVLQLAIQRTVEPAVHHAYISTPYSAQN